MDGAKRTQKSVPGIVQIYAAHRSAALFYGCQQKRGVGASYGSLYHSRFYMGIQGNPVDGALFSLLSGGKSAINICGQHFQTQARNRLTFLYVVCII